MATQTDPFQELADKIADAIKNKNYDAVTELSQELAKLQESNPPKKKRGRPKKKAETPKEPPKRRGRPQKTAPSPSLPKNSPRRVPDDDFPILGPQKVEKPKRTNYFVDNLQFALVDDEGNSLLQNKKPPPRQGSDRPEFQKVQVVCCKCGKKEKVNPIMARKSVGDDETEYRCNNCSVLKG